MNLTFWRVTQRASLCALLFLFGLRAQAQNYTFGNASYSAPALSFTSPPEGNPGIVAADLNSDGIPDLAILGSASGGQVLSIFLGKSDGSFAPRVDYSVQATGFTIGDFNGDGKVDIIVVNDLYPIGASILIGNGDGTFQPPVALNQSINNCTAAASADFNADGKPDLILLTPDFGGGATIAILLGNGDGTFQPQITYSVPVAPYLALGDFNGDGKLDVAIAGTSEISILINKGDGTFKSPVNYSVSGSIQAIAAADLNGDGKLDLVVPTGGFSAAISVLLGNGDGSFGSPIVYTSSLLSIYSTSMAVADFNGDGKPDVALTDSGGPTNAVAILLGNGDGTFQSPPLLYSAGLMPTGVVSLDVNGDRKPDLAVAGGYGAYSSLTTLINRGNGTFPNPVTYSVLQYPYSAVIGDFNGDGTVDIATTSLTPSGGVSVLLGNGDGTFQSHLDSPTGQSPRSIVTGDFNGDGKLDLVVADSTSTSALLSTLIGNGDGTFQNSISQTLPGVVVSLAVGDFNRDGKLDVAVTGSTSNAVSIFLGQGDGTFAPPVQYPTGPMLLSPPYHNVLVGDFNGDHKLDLAVATDNGVAVLLGNGDGTFQPFSLVPSLLSYDPGDELVALADFNGDGKLDILKSTQTGIINVALGNGDGTFQQAPGFQIPSIMNTQSAIVGDFDSDGNLDVAFASQSSDVVTILFGEGTGAFKGHIEYAAGSVSTNVNFMAAADFNGDGALDLAWADFGSSEVSVSVNSAIAVFSPRVLNFPSQGIGTTSPEQSVTLTNAGAAQLSLSSIAATGDFAENNDCGSTLSTAKACTVNVTFVPTATGLRSGTLAFTDNASVVPEQLILSGTGTPAGFLIGVSPGSSASQTVTTGQTANFSLVVTPEGSFNGTVTLACSGAPAGATCTATPASFSLTGATAVVLSVATTGAAFAPPPAPNSIPVLPVLFQLHFKLAWPYLFLITFLIVGVLGIISCRHRRSAWMAPAAAAMLVLIWAGCGGGSPSAGPPPAPSAAVSPSSLTFSSQNQGTTSPMHVATLGNSGSATLSITAISVGGANVGDFQQTNSCGSSVAAGGNCSIDVTFTPTTTGSRSATLNIADNASGSPQVVSLTGTGVPPATPAGTYTITVTATSGTLAQSTSLTLTVQ